MLTAHVDRYIALRQSLGFKLRGSARLLQAFARFAVARGDTPRLFNAMGSPGLRAGYRGPPGQRGSGPGWLCRSCLT